MPTLKDKKVKEDMRCGYTLIELLVVISIITVIFSSGFASYREYQRRQFSETATRLLKGDLRLAQEYAIAGKKPDTTPDNACETTDLQGYRFRRVTATSYQVEAVCAGGTSIVKGPVTLPVNTQLNAISGGDTFMFRVLGRGVDRTTDITMTIVNATTSLTSQVVVTPTGEIR